MPRHKVKKKRGKSLKHWMIASSILIISVVLVSIIYSYVGLEPLTGIGGTAYKSPAGDSRGEINLHGTRRVIKNTAVSAYFIPANTTGEWSAFIANPPGGVSACEPGCGCASEVCTGSTCSDTGCYDVSVSCAGTKQKDCTSTTDAQRCSGVSYTCPNGCGTSIGTKGRVDGTWSEGGWSSCSCPGGLTGTKTRSVSCNAECGGTCPGSEPSSSTGCTCCTVSKWSPLRRTVCSGTDFTQTSNCGTTRTRTGTKKPSCSGEDKKHDCGNTYGIDIGCGVVCKGTGTKCGSGEKCKSKGCVAKESSKSKSSSTSTTANSESSSTSTTANSGSTQAQIDPGDIQQAGAATCCCVLKSDGSGDCLYSAAACC